MPAEGGGAALRKGADEIVDGAARSAYDQYLGAGGNRAEEVGGSAQAVGSGGGLQQPDHRRYPLAPARTRGERLPDKRKGPRVLGFKGPSVTQILHAWTLEPSNPSSQLLPPERCSSSSMTALKFGNGCAPLILRPLIKKAGVPVTPTDCPSAMSALT